MRIYTKFKGLGPRGPGPWVYGALTLAAAGVLGWVWWHSVQTVSREPVAALTNTVAMAPPVVKPINHEFTRINTNTVVMATPAAKPAVVPPVTRPAQPVSGSPSQVIVSNRVGVLQPPPTLGSQTNLLPKPVIPPVAEGTFTPRPTMDPLEVQLALIRQGFSPGSMDGVIGSQTRSALRAFQQKQGLTASGNLDIETRNRLYLTLPPYITYTVTSADLARLRPLSPTWAGKSQQDRLDYETILELLAEKGQAYPGLVRSLNPGIDWTNVVAGAAVTLPNAVMPAVRGKAAYVRIQLSNRLLQVYDGNEQLEAQFPCSIAKFAEKRPVGTLHVAVAAANPNYRFDPKVFPESPEAQKIGHPLMIPAGPNNPVGVAWIGLDKPGYGIHRTPAPESVGRTESHGCFRLANWNAEHLLKRAWIGMPVYVEP